LLGLEKTATPEEIKKAYRKVRHATNMVYNTSEKELKVGTI